MTDYIEHFGVKGMKWGIRKERTYNTDFAKVSNVSVKTNSDGSKTFPKNFAFNRIGQAQLDINESGALYVSYGKEDASRYVTVFGPTPLKKLFGGETMSVQHLKVKEPIKMPSEKETISETINALRSDPKLLNAFKNSMYSLSVTESFDEIDDKTFRDMLSNQTPKKAAVTSYAVSNMLGNGAFAGDAKMFYSHFRKQGWDAIPDLHDSFLGVSSAPMIVINPNKIAFESSTLITKDIMASGRQYVKELGKLPGSEYLK